MFSRISNSWELVKASWRVLQADRELLIFPVISFIGSIIVMITFAVPMAIAGVFDSVAGDGSIGLAGMIMGFLFYLVMYTVVIFSNVALVGAAMIRMRGGDPTVRDGFNIAMEHLSQIVGYAAISATVGIILRTLRERGGIGGAIASMIGGMVWGVATYLVVPVLVVENVGPIDAIKRSTNLLKHTWGEQIVGNFSIGLIFSLLTVAIVIVAGVPVIALAAATESVFAIIVAVGLVILVVLGMSLLSTTLNGIYVAAVYRYATESVVTDEFDAVLIESAFRHK